MWGYLVVGALLIVSGVVGVIAYRCRQQLGELQQALAALSNDKQTLTNSLTRQETLLSERTRQLDDQVRTTTKTENENTKLNDQLTTEKQERSRIQGEKELLQQRVAELTHDNQKALQNTTEIQQSLENARIELQKMQTTLDKERSHHQEQLQLLQNAKTELTNQFKAVSSELLELNAKKMTDVNQENLSQLLNPLRERMGEFQQKVETYQTQGGKDAEALRESIRNMMEATKNIGQEANNLTNALKGTTKAQGNFGELILESLLENADLKKGVEYEIQESLQTEEGRRLQPDVVIHMPQGRDLIIDSKMTLQSYEDYCAATTEEEKNLSLKALLTSFRSHVKNLSSKNYQTNVAGAQSVDYVVMFIPLEGAYVTAVNADDSLHMEAWEQNVIIATRSTLLMMLRIVSSLWRQAEQSRNAQEIAKRGAELYDKLVAFTGDLLKVGTQIQAAESTYTTAMKRLSEGRGNVIRQAEMLKELGVKPSKQMPDSLVAKNETDTQMTLLESTPATPSEPETVS